MLESLPSEILIHAILFLGPLGIRRCRQVCRKLADVIKASTHIQFILELGLMNYSEPMQPRRDLSYAEKIKVLREHNDRLVNLSSIPRYEVDIQDTEPVFALNNTPELFVFAHGRKLHLSDNNLTFMQLASRNRGTIYDTWTLNNLGVQFLHAIADCESELLVLFECPPSEAFVKVHLRCVRSGVAHPTALHPVLVAATTPCDIRWLLIKAQLIGKVLSVIIPAAGNAEHLFIWDWTSGAQLANKRFNTIQNPQFCDEQFLFATESEYAAIRSTPSSTNAPASIGNISVCAYSAQTLGDTNQQSRRITYFDLPVRDDVEYRAFHRSYLPQVLKSFFSSTNKIFDLAPNQQWLQLELFIRKKDSDDRICVVLFISFGALVDMARSASSNADGRVVRFPWHSWAKHTAWMLIPNRYHYSPVCVYGCRAAYLVHGPSGDDILSIYDLSLCGTKQADQPDVGRLETEGVPLGRQVFEGSHYPRVVSTFRFTVEIFSRVNIETPPISMVMMMDEDYLIIHREESSESIVIPLFHT